MVQIMGILNVTPDSFSDGGLYFNLKNAIDHAVKMATAGADIIDVGGESTRPGAEPVSQEEEIARVIPVIKSLARMLPVRISIDTRKPLVAQCAIEAGATLVNDVSASLVDVCAKNSVGWIAMHMKGDPKTMQKHADYQDVVKDVYEFLLDRASYGKQSGIEEIYIDPGIGFGKTVEHNVKLLSNLDVFAESGFKLAVGTSRKSFLGVIGKISDEVLDVKDRLAPTLATAAWMMKKGVSILRVHDVKEVFELKKLFELCG